MKICRIEAQNVPRWFLGLPGADSGVKIKIIENSNQKKNEKIWGVGGMGRRPLNYYYYHYYSYY